MQICLVMSFCCFGEYLAFQIGNYMLFIFLLYPVHVIKTSTEIDQRETNERALERLNSSLFEFLGPHTGDFFNQGGDFSMLTLASRLHERDFSLG